MKKHVLTFRIIAGLAAGVALVLGVLFTEPGRTAFQAEDIVYEQCEANTVTAAHCEDFAPPLNTRAKNIILIIGDGMGVNQIYAARVYLNGPDKPLAFEDLPNQGLMSTCSVDEITDSAASATAMSTGYKTMNGSISVLAIPRFERLDNLWDRVHLAKAVGVVSTCAVWDAPPAAFVSHAPLRSQARKIAREMVQTSRPQVIMGGGDNAFESKSALAISDPRGNLDLIAAARDQGYTILRTKDDLEHSDPKNVKEVLGLFADESMNYEIERGADSTEPRLSEMAAYALKVLDRDPRGFFLMIEGGRIDHACHETNLDKMLGEMKEFNKTVEQTLAWAAARGDTLVIITADHETGGITVNPRDYHRGDKVAVTWTTSDFPGHAGHSSQRVAIFATGPGADAIRPRMDNTDICCVIDRAFGINLN